MDTALQGQKVDLVKIDVEGHEPLVLQGNQFPQESVDGVMQRYKKTQHHLDLLFTSGEMADKIPNHI